MITDASIREQGYIYFLSEAPELLQIIEQELFSISKEYSIAKVHNLMRATHTIKGGAANVGLDVINKVAHYLEDVFKALYNPEIHIDNELQTLLIQAYECLHIPLTAQLQESSVNDEEILQRAASVFAQLQEKLGDALTAETHIPTSEELGFDIVLSIFETGISQRIESISEIIENFQNATELAEFLRSHAAVFLGLAESLNLPGFGKIAETIIAALDANPSQALQIAKLALADLRNSQAAVLAGDRTSGGEPSLALLELTTSVTDYEADVVELSVEPTIITSVISDASTTSSNSEIYELYNFLIKTANEPLKPTVANFYLKVIRYIFGWFNHEKAIPLSEFRLALLIPIGIENSVNYLEKWLGEFFDFVQNEEDGTSLCLYRQGVISTILHAVAKFLYETSEGDISAIQTLQNKISELALEYRNYPAVTGIEKNWHDSPKLQKLLEIKEISTTESPQSNDNLIETIWGDEIYPTLDYEIVTPDSPEVESDNSSDVQSLTVNEPVVANITEIIIPDEPIKNHKPIQNKLQPTIVNNSKKRSFVRVDVEGLERLNYLAGELLIFQKRRTLQDEQLKEIIEQLFQQLQRHQRTLNKVRDLPLQMQEYKHRQIASVDFDSLEMDEYSEFHLRLHEAIEETLQLQETTESLDLLLRQSTLTHDKKQRLASGIIDNIVEARMLPLGDILNRFTQMIHNLGNMYSKNVEIKLSGTEVLVDKAIAEKLYDPLLHLVRNAFDHGIEPPEVRRERGKAEQGLIEISAYHQGSQTVIEVRDDGQGLNFEKVHKKAIELGFIQADDETSGYIPTPTREQLLEFLFAPGFSTAGKVSEISGRGIGLDIVRSQLQALNGSISVQSFPNQGTTFVLKIPFSMTTDQLMLVQAGSAVYALLLESIEKILLPSAVNIKEFEGKKVLHWNAGNDERMVSVRQLTELMYYNSPFVSGATLQTKSTTHDAEAMTNPVLLLRQNQELLGLEVDQIIGEQELVIRPLGQTITAPKYVYGCSTLANGTLILVIDGALLLETSVMQATIDVMALPTAHCLEQKTLPMLSLQTTQLLAPSSESEGLAPKVILVVDDAISLRQTITLTLQKSGYQVLQAQNGVEALEQLQLHPEVQLVISDLEMPRMNGFELLSNVRQNPNLANKPVVILTSRSAEKHRQLASALGATAYLTKPYLEHEFLSTVENLINRSIDDLTQVILV